MRRREKYCENYCCLCWKQRDIQPLIELGVEMRKRGHDFRAAGMDKFQTLAEEKSF